MSNNFRIKKRYYDMAAGATAMGMSAIGGMTKMRRRYGSVPERIPKESTGFHAGNINATAGSKVVTKSRAKTALQKLIMQAKMNESSNIFRWQGLNPKNPFTQFPAVSSANDYRGFFTLNKQWSDEAMTDLKLPIYVFNMSGVCATTNSGGTTLYTRPMYRLHKRVTATSATDQNTANYYWVLVSGQGYDGIATNSQWLKEKMDSLGSSTDKYYYENVWTHAEMAFYLGINGTKAKVRTSLVKFIGNQGPKRLYSNDTTADVDPTPIEQHNIDLWWTHYLDRHLVGPLSNTNKYESKKPFIETSVDCNCLAVSMKEEFGPGQRVTETAHIKRIMFKDNSLYKYNRVMVGEEYNRPNILTSTDAQGYPISNFGGQEAINMANTHVMSNRMADTWLMIQADHFGVIHTTASPIETQPLSFDLKIRCKQIYNSTK